MAALPESSKSLPTLSIGAVTVAESVLTFTRMSPWLCNVPPSRCEGYGPSIVRLFRYAVDQAVLSYLSSAHIQLTI